MPMLCFHHVIFLLNPFLRSCPWVLQCTLFATTMLEWFPDPGRRERVCRWTGNGHMWPRTWKSFRHSPALWAGTHVSSLARPGNILKGSDGVSLCQNALRPVYTWPRSSPHWLRTSVEVWDQYGVYHQSCLVTSIIWNEFVLTMSMTYHWHTVNCTHLRQQI